MSGHSAEKGAGRFACPDCPWVHAAHPLYGWSDADDRAVEVHWTMLCPAASRRPEIPMPDQGDVRCAWSANRLPHTAHGRCAGFLPHLAEGLQRLMDHPPEGKP